MTRSYSTQTHVWNKTNKILLSFMFARFIGHQKRWFFTPSLTESTWWYCDMCLCAFCSELSRKSRIKPRKILVQLKTLMVLRRNLAWNFWSVINHDEIGRLLHLAQSWFGIIRYCQKAVDCVALEMTQWSPPTPGVSSPLGAGVRNVLMQIKAITKRVL